MTKIAQRQCSAERVRVRFSRNRSLLGSQLTRLDWSGWGPGALEKWKEREEEEEEGRGKARWKIGQEARAGENTDKRDMPTRKEGGRER